MSSRSNNTPAAMLYLEGLITENIRDYGDSLPDLYRASQLAHPLPGEKPDSQHATYLKRRINREKKQASGK